MRRTLLLLLPAILIVGCSGAAVPRASTAVVGSSVSAPATAASQALSSSPTASADLIGFVRSGGLIGIADQLTIAQDGSFTLVRAKPAKSRSGRLTPTELAQLKELMADPGLSEPPAQPQVPENDRFSYRLTFDGQRIAAQDGNVPVPLQRLITALVSMLATYGS